MKNILLSLFPNIKTNKPRQISRPLDIVIQSLLSPLQGITEKQSISLWSPTTFEGTRSGANARYVSMLVYDIDDGIAPYSSWRLFTDYCVLAHTSFSHSAAHHKYRIILPLATPIPAGDWSRASIAARELWDFTVGRGEPDNKALKDVARVYYRYAHKLNNHSVCKDHPLYNLQQEDYHLGPLLDLDYSHIEIPKVQPRTYKPMGKRSMQDVMLDRTFRAAAADKLGAKIVGNNARNILCPNCNRNTVYFSIDLSLPNATKWPTCNHDRNCKYWGSFEDLLGGML